MAGQKAQYRLLAVNGRQGRNAHIELNPITIIENTPILGQPFFRDIQIGQNFDLIHQRCILRSLHNITFCQLTVDAHPDTATRFVRFDMNIAGIIAECFADKRHQKPRSRSNVLQTARLRSRQPNGVAAIVLQHEAVKLFPVKRHDLRLPAAKRLQFADRHRIITAGLTIATHPSLRPFERNKPVFRRFRSRQ